MASRIVQYFADKLRTNKEYPVTLTKAVYDENENRLDNVIGDTSIASIGDGSITGAVSSLDTEITSLNSSLGNIAQYDDSVTWIKNNNVVRVVNENGSEYKPLEASDITAKTSVGDFALSSLRNVPCTYVANNYDIETIGNYMQIQNVNGYNNSLSTIMGGKLYRLISVATSSGNECQQIATSYEGNVIVTRQKNWWNNTWTSWKRLATSEDMDRKIGTITPIIDGMGTDYLLMKSGNVVVFNGNINISNATANDWVHIITIPTGYRPRDYAAYCSLCDAFGNTALASFSNDGVVRVFKNSADMGAYTYFNATWITN